MVREGREMLPGGGWARARALNHKFQAGKQRHGLLLPEPLAQASRPCVSCPGLGSNVTPARKPFLISLWVWSPPSDALRPPFDFFFFFLAQNTYHGVNLWIYLCDDRINVRASQHPPLCDKLSQGTNSAYFLSLVQLWCSDRGFDTSWGLSHSSNQSVRSFIRSLMVVFSAEKQGKESEATVSSSRMQVWGVFEAFLLPWKCISGGNPRTIYLFALI